MMMPFFPISRLFPFTKKISPIGVFLVERNCMNAPLTDVIDMPDFIAFMFLVKLNLSCFFVKPHQRRCAENVAVKSRDIRFIFNQVCIDARVFTRVYKHKTNKAVFFKGKAYRRDRAPYSQSVREVAAELKKPCLELFDNQQKIMEAMGEEEAGKLYRFKPDGKIDGSHTNKAGAELLAKIIITELRKSDCPLSEYTIDPQLKVPLPKETPAKKAAPAKKTHKKSSQSKKNSKK